jgi:hypothetical protein
VLKPGGSWRAVDGLRTTQPPTDEMEDLHCVLQKGWKLPPIMSLESVQRILVDLAFGDLIATDLSAMAAPTARGFIQQRPRYMFQYMLDMLGQVGPSFLDHVNANAAFSEGLLAGYFSYNLVGGTVGRTSKGIESAAANDERQR